METWIRCSSPRGIGPQIPGGRLEPQRALDPERWAACLQHICITSSASHDLGGHYYVKWGWHEHKHWDSATVTPITETAPKWLADRRHTRCWYTWTKRYSGGTGQDGPNFITPLGAVYSFKRTNRSLLEVLIWYFQTTVEGGAMQKVKPWTGEGDYCCIKTKHKVSFSLFTSNRWDKNS